MCVRASRLRNFRPGRTECSAGCRQAGSQAGGRTKTAVPVSCGGLRSCPSAIDMCFVPVNLVTRAVVRRKATSGILFGTSVANMRI